MIVNCFFTLHSWTTPCPIKKETQKVDANSESNGERRCGLEVGGRSRKDGPTDLTVFKMKEVISRETRVVIQMTDIWICVVIFWENGVGMQLS